MIFKTVNVRASRVSAGKASSALKSHLKYLQYRERDPLKEAREDRFLFNREADQITRKAAHAHVMEKPAGDIYYHRMILSPSDSEPVSDWQQWTRAIMSDLERHLRIELDWYAVMHRNTDHPHVHVVLRGTGASLETGRAQPVTLTPQEFKMIKESGRQHSDQEHYRQIQHVLRQLDQFDDAERLEMQEHRQSVQNEARR